MRSDWVDLFVEQTDQISSPVLFRKWAAIYTIAATLERKVWVRTARSNVYPNMYIILVAPPGVGKTEVTWRARDLLSSLEDHQLASTSVTKASLIDELAAATRRWVISSPKPGQNPVDSFNSLILCINELGVLIPAYENEFMNTLTDLWDGKGYSESRRTTKVTHKIDKPQLNMIAGCTPSYLVHVLPEGAWDQGFLSRTMLIYSGDSQKRSLFAETSIDQQEWDHLQTALEAISAFYGEMNWEQAAAEKMDAFHLSDGEPKPNHPKLLSYTIRRTVHLIKLCMVASVSRGDDLTIREADFNRAFGWLIEAETQMPEIFKAMSSGGTASVMDDTWHFIYEIYMKENKPIMKHRIIQFLLERVPAHNVETTLDMMVQANLIERSLEKAGPAYKPKPKTAH